MDLIEVREVLSRINGDADLKIYSDEVGYSSYQARAWYDGNLLIGEEYLRWEEITKEEALAVARQQGLL